MSEMTVAPETSSAPRPRPSLWRNRDYMLLWSGQIVSVLGSGISGIAFPLLVLALTGSPAQAGLVVAAAGLPYLILSLPAGALVDRWNRKRVMILCDVGRGLNAASIPIAAALFSLTVTQLYINAVIEGTLFVFFNVAEVAALPRVVAKEQLPAASGQNEAAMFGASLISPPLGGFLFQAFSQTSPWVADAVSYGASVISLLFIRIPFQAERTEAPRRIWTEIREGIIWLWNQPLIRFITFLSGGLNFAGNATYLLVIIIAHENGASAAYIGVMLAIGSVGGFVGSLLAPRIQRQFGFGLVIIGSVWAQTLLFPLFAFVRHPLLFGVVFAGITLFAPIFNAMQLSYRLSVIPDELQGRVNSAVRLVTFGAIPPGAALAGILIQRVGPRPAVLFFATVMALLSIAATLNPHVRHARKSGHAQ